MLYQIDNFFMRVKFRILPMKLNLSIMKKVNLILLLLLAVLLSSCFRNLDEEPTITSPIIISNQQHHVGDNPGAEGLSLYAEFEMPKNFSYAELDITFVYPDEDETSGPDVDTPPEVSINGYKIGTFKEDFLQYPECISDDREFHCTITFTFVVTDVLQAGSNEFRITSKAYLDNYDDFTFSDVEVLFE